MRLESKVAIVTGAASGIGRAIARRFAAEGAVVVIADVIEAPREGGTPTLEQMAEAGGRAEFVETDVASWAAVDALVSDVVARHGRLDVMVNNAAISDGKRLTETEEADWDRVIGVNLKGVFFGCKRAVQQMLTQEPLAEEADAETPEAGVRGRIINISSQHGMIAAPRDFAYGVGKGGVVYMTRQIAADYAEQGIVCNAVAPGKIITGQPGRAVESWALDYARGRTPMPRLGRPDDVAGAALYLASAEARYVTGINLLVDGGWMAA